MDLRSLEIELETRAEAWGEAIFRATAKLLPDTGPVLQASSERHQLQHAIEDVLDDLAAALLATTQLGHLPFAVAASGTAPRGVGIG